MVLKLFLLLLLAPSLLRADHEISSKQRTRARPVDLLRDLFFDPERLVTDSTSYDVPRPGQEPKTLAILKPRLTEPRFFCDAEKRELTSYHVIVAELLRKAPNALKTEWKEAHDLYSLSEFKKAREARDTKRIQEIAFLYPLTDGAREATLFLAAQYADRADYQLAALLYDKLFLDFPDLCKTNRITCEKAEFIYRGARDEAGVEFITKQIPIDPEPKFSPPLDGKSPSLERVLGSLRLDDIHKISPMQRQGYYLLALLGTKAMRARLKEGSFAQYPCIEIHNVLALAKMGPLANMETLEMGDAAARQKVFERLQRYSGSPIIVLGRALRDPDPSIRSWAFSTLQHFVPNRDFSAATPSKDFLGAAPGLDFLLDDANPHVRRNALETIIKANLAKEMLPSLSKALRHEDLREEISFALMRVPADAKEAIPALIEVLKDRKTRHTGIADALVRFPMFAEPAIPFLINDMKDHPDARDRAAAGEALKTMGKYIKLNAPAVIELLDSADNEKRVQAMEILTKMGADAKGAVPKLLKALEDEKLSSQAAPALAAVAVHSEDLVPELVKSMQATRSIKTHLDIMRALGSLPEKSAKEIVPALIQDLKKPQPPPIRGAAARYLGKFGKHAKEAVPALIEQLEDKECSYVRKEAAAALGEIGPEAKAAVPALLEALKESEDLGDAARGALLSIVPLK